MTRGRLPSPEGDPAADVPLRLVTLTRELPGSPDLGLLAARARDAGWDGAVVERTVPEAVSVAAVGRALELVTDSTGTYLEVDRQRQRVGPATGGIGLGRAWRELAASALVLDDPGMPATGLVAIGGFAFSPERLPQGPWAGFPGALLRVPTLAVVRTGGRCFSVAAMLAPADVSPAGLRRRLGRAARLVRLAAPPERGSGLPARIRATPPSGSRERWETAVGLAAAALRQGRAEKVVLARAVTARADRPLSLARVVGALRAAYPGAHTFALGGADGTCLVGSSPELLISRHGDRVVSRPLAGSTGRDPSPARDRALARALRADPKERAEHRAVVEDIRERLLPVVRRIAVADQPTVLRLPTIQHLATTIRARLAGPHPPSALELAALLHPTPAVGGRPREAALGLLAEIEDLERGWYTGAIGWVDGRGDGELAIALRCGLLVEDGALCFAGCGIMPGSDPAREWAETELKLQPVLRALAS
ncbi:MAG TPA: isochorismate synthase [Verrucomicrobiae bacterium]|nr:isochorismate synthase [Verrucomicrobiae bacterium]